MTTVIRRGPWLWLFAIAVLVAGCSGGSSPGWVRSDIKPVTQPGSAGGLLILYAEAGGGLQVDALDPKTGKTVWHDKASPGNITPGVPPVLGVAGSTVAFLRAVGDSSFSQLVGVDAATGRQLWHTRDGMFDDWPRACADDPVDICTTGSIGLAQQTQVLRYRASDGAQAGAIQVSQSTAGRQVGPDLFDPGTRNPEKLLGVSGSSVAWTRPLSSVFPAPGLSTDYGWNFDRLPAAGLFVGSVLGAPVGGSGSSPTFDLSRAMTAGFRISDGTTVWRDAGTMYACGEFLPCPLGAKDASGNQTPVTGLRLRATGTVSVNNSSLAEKFSPGADVVVEGFDLATGKTLWSYDTRSSGLLLNQQPALLGPDVIALPVPGGGQVALNLATGAHRPIPPGSSARGSWCTSTTTYKTQVGYPTDTGSVAYQRVGQVAIKPCKASRASTTPQSVPGFVGTGYGTNVDGLTAWSEPSEVAAAPTTS